MSGNIASRYIGGVPYGPAMSVSNYLPRAANLPPGSPVAQPPVTPVTPVVPGGVGAIGGGIDPRTGAVTQVGGLGDVGGGGGNMLLAAALGALPYLPDAYNAVSDWFGSSATPPVGDLPTPPEFLTPEQAFDLPRTPETEWAADATVGPWGMPAVQFGGSQFGWVAPGSSPWAPAGTDGIIWDPTGAAANLGTAGNGWVHPGDLGGGGFGSTLGGDLSGGFGGEPMASVSAPPSDLGGGLSWLNNPLGLSEALFAAPDFGLGSLGGFNLDAAPLYAPAAIFNHGIQGLAKPGGEAGASIGATAGLALGTLIAGPYGAALGTLAGGAIGGQIGPAPTVGRNFSSFGTFNPDGSIGWNGAGGDNGGGAADASGFTDWFTPVLAQAAQAQGLAFNPNMAGAQIRVGGYDNFSRRARTAGGYFYDVAPQGAAFGGSPENYVLRPATASAWAPGTGYLDDAAFGAGQADDFTRHVLADLTARGVYVPVGQQGPGADYLANSIGADYGYYQPGASFGDVLAQRQGVIGGFVGERNRLADLRQNDFGQFLGQVGGWQIQDGQFYAPGYGLMDAPAGYQAPAPAGYWNEGMFMPGVASPPASVNDVGGG